MLVDEYGLPIGLAVSGANRHDIKLAEPTRRKPQNMCLDKWYDFPEIDELVEERGYTVTSPGGASTNRRERESRDTGQDDGSSRGPIHG